LIYSAHTLNRDSVGYTSATQKRKARIKAYNTMD
jgi:hypothetical protein